MSPFRPLPYYLRFPLDAVGRQTFEDPAIRDSSVRIMWVGDSHIRDDLGRDSFRERALQRAVARANEYLPDLVGFLGDGGNNTVSNVKRFFANIRHLRRPSLEVVGNHDEIFTLAHDLASRTSAETGDITTPFMFNSEDENRDPRLPIMKHRLIPAGDGSWTLGVVTCDTNYYGTQCPNRQLPYPYTEADGKRLGYTSAYREPVGGCRRLTSAQTGALDALFETHTGSVDAWIIMIHYPPFRLLPTSPLLVGDIAVVADSLQAHGYTADTARFICCHVHAHTRSGTVPTTDGSIAYPALKPTSIQEPGCWYEAQYAFPEGVLTSSLVCKGAVARAQVQGWRWQKADCTFDFDSSVAEPGWEFVDAGDYITVRAISE